MAAIGFFADPVCSGALPPPTKLTSILAVYPPASPAASAFQLSSRIKVVLPPVIPAEQVFCKFGANGNAILGEYEISSSGFAVKCSIPQSLETADSISVSIDSSFPVGFSPSFPFTIYSAYNITSITPYSSLAQPSSGVLVTIKGTNFQEFFGCQPLQPRDILGHVYDCLQCVFYENGNFLVSPIMAATFIDSSTITCRVPPPSLIPGSSNIYTLAVSLNGNIFLSQLAFMYTSPPPSTTPHLTFSTAPTSHSPNLTPMLASPLLLLFYSISILALFIPLSRTS